MTTAVTTKDFANKVIELADESPGFIYEKEEGGRCLYIRDEKGDCIVGQAAVELGFEVDKIQEFEGQPADFMIRSLLGLETDRNEIQYKEDPYIDFCDVVQSDQDSGRAWGDAILMNRHYLPGEL